MTPLNPILGINPSQATMRRQAAQILIATFLGHLKNKDDGPRQTGHGQVGHGSLAHGTQGMIGGMERMQLG